ncbi:unnamed protein product [Rhizoctonia solani]|uniref:Transmembrane protein n=1 Tax=Rhizoctonia solani TaxID=456999 RepID=A0A8H2XZS4_9AGAM|nr:unnamed protein product [Rhizoctonia solani]
MIIADQQPSSPSSKRSFVTEPTTRTETPSTEYDAPPAYHPPLPSSPLPQPPPTPIHKPHPNSGKRRFWRAILIGLGVYVVVSATVVTPLLVYRLRGSKTIQEPDPVQTAEPTRLPDHGDRPPHRHWPPPGGPDSDSRWDIPHPRPPKHDHDHEHGPGGPPPPWRGPHGWNPDCENRGQERRPDCRPPNVPHVDGMVVSCNKWRKPTAGEQRPATDPMPYNSFLKYQLPLDKDVFIRSAGKMTAGAFQLVVDEKIETMEVDVEMRFNEHRSYDHTNVCLMNRDHSDPPAMGLGIYMPFGQAPDENISFNITLRVPLMHYNYTLDTHLPIFDQKVFSRAGVYFNRIRLSGAASPMLLEGVDAGIVDAKTVYERIRAIGVRAAKKIRLATIDSPIDVMIAATSNSNSTEPVQIDLQTMNDHIAGAILLEHNGAIKPGDEDTPDFALDVKTGNSPIFLRVMHTERSEPSVLHANLTTNLGEIELMVDPQFEGTFELVADQAKSDVEEDAVHTADPSGMGRLRSVSVKRVQDGFVRGSVAWRNMSFRSKEAGLGIWSGDKVKLPRIQGSRIHAVTSMKTNVLLLPSASDMDRVTEERAALFRALEEKEVDSVAERMRKAGGVGA